MMTPDAPTVAASHGSEEANRYACSSGSCDEGCVRAAAQPVIPNERPQAALPGHCDGSSPRGLQHWRELRPCTCRPYTEPDGAYVRSAAGIDGLTHGDESYG